MSEELLNVVRQLLETPSRDEVLEALRQYLYPQQEQSGSSYKDTESSAHRKPVRSISELVKFIETNAPQQLSVEVEVNGAKHTFTMNRFREHSVAAQTARLGYRLGDSDSDIQVSHVFDCWQPELNLQQALDNLRELAQKLIYKRITKRSVTTEPPKPLSNVINESMPHGNV